MTSIFNDVPIFKKNDKYKESNIISTNLNLYNTEQYINNILNNNEETCNYYINITESIYCIQLKLNDYDSILQSMVDIYIFKDDIENIILYLSDEIDMYNEWSAIKNEIISKFN